MSRLAALPAFWTLLGVVVNEVFRLLGTYTARRQANGATKGSGDGGTQAEASQ